LPRSPRMAGSWAHVTSAQEAQAQQAARSQVPATLLQAPSYVTVYPAAGYAPLGAVARWRAPTGQVRTGLLFAPSGTTAGSTVPVWVDRAGQLTNSPLGPAQLATRACLAGEVAVGILAIALIAVGRLVRWILDRRRMAAWDADWLVTEPRWTSRQ